MHSFEVCNEYDNVEWIFVDLGSTDGSRDYIREYSRKAGFSVKVIFDDEEDYFNIIRKTGFSVDNHWKKLRSILGLYRNKAKIIAEGEYIFDLADDQQFIRKGNWIEEIFEVFKHRKLKIGKDDIISLVPYAYYRWRLDKPNNTRLPIENKDSAPYYLAAHKPYVDYSVMKKEMFNKVGKFITPLDFGDDFKKKNMWKLENESLSPWVEYEKRCENLGLVRVFLKYPIFMLFPNDLPDSFNFPNNDKLICKVWTLEEMKKKFGNLDRPISSEELDNGSLYPSFNYNKYNFLKRIYNRILKMKF